MSYAYHNDHLLWSPDSDIRRKYILRSKNIVYNEEYLQWSSNNNKQEVYLSVNDNS